jgi:hypothetical protein
MYNTYYTYNSKIIRFNNEIICYNVCQFRRKAADYADYLILLWQLWQPNERILIVFQSVSRFQQI